MLGALERGGSRGGQRSGHGSCLRQLLLAESRHHVGILLFSLVRTDSEVRLQTRFARVDLGYSPWYAPASPESVFGAETPHRSPTA